MAIEFHSASVSMHTMDGDLENRSIPELVSILRTAFRIADFDKVEAALVAKEVKMKMEIESKNRECKSLQDEYEFLRLDIIAHESSLKQFKIEPKESERSNQTPEKLKKCEKDLQVLKELIVSVNEDREAAHEKGKKALEQYEKLLEEVKIAEESNKKIIEELNHKNSEVSKRYDKLLGEVKKSEEDKEKIMEELYRKNSEVSGRYEKLLEDVKKSEEDNRKIVEELNSKNSEVTEQCDKLLEEVKKSEIDNEKIMEELNLKNSEVSERYEKVLEEIKKVEEDKKKVIEELNSKNSELECDLEHWKMKYEELGHRVLQLENTYTKLKNGEPVASNKFFETVGCSSGSRELVGKKGTAKNKTENQTGTSGHLIEIIDSDDDCASNENSSGVWQMRKRKRDSCLNDCEDNDVERDDERNTILLGESKVRESFEKVGAVLRTFQDDSPAKFGIKTCFSSHTSDFRRVSTSPRVAAVTLRQCEEKVGAECKSHSQFKSATNVKDHSFEDCYISLESDHSTHNEENKGTNSQGSKCKKKWECEAEMLAAFEENDDLCMEAVCALYRQSNLKGKHLFAYLPSRHRGFNNSDVQRGTTLALFLTNKNPQGNLKKSVMELEKFDIRGLSDCKKIAIEHLSQLFEIYKNKEDQFLSD